MIAQIGLLNGFQSLGVEVHEIEDVLPHTLGLNRRIELGPKE